MKRNDIEQIKAGEFVQHKHYGLCYVEKNEFTTDKVWFGLIIRPLSIEGYNKIALYSGCYFNRYIEGSNRLIISKVENPKIPNLIFQTENGYEVHKWNVLGEVSDKGEFSTIKLKEFESLDEAMLFAELS